MKKGQITVFIILGVVIFIVIGLLFYLKITLQTKEFDAEKAAIQDLFITHGKYNSYIQSCLDTVAKQAIAYIGMQGGVIYEYQASLTKPFLGPRKYDYGQYVLPFQYDDIYDLYPNERTVIFNVSYGIYAPDLSKNTDDHPNVPLYPYGAVKLIEDPTQIKNTYTNMFGNVVKDPLPPLCDYNGANSPMQKGSVYSCETYDSHRETDNDNIQEYMEAYITHTLGECVNLESLPEFAETGVRTGNIKIKITMAPTAITVKADYPVVADVRDYEATLALQTFYTTIPVRLQQIHELATRIIEQDINNIFFNIVRDANELTDCKELGKEQKVVRCLKEGMEVVKYRDVCKQLGLCRKYGQYDDILIISDNKSVINGKPYMFLFAIQNRPPAIDLIYNNEDSKIYNGYDLLVTEGDTIHINPYGYDPDEDYHGYGDYMDGRYIYALWKEDYDEVNGVRSVYPADIRFTTSKEWKDTGREATYKTNSGDIGTHLLQVQICDNEGLCDFQNIKILVKGQN